VLIADSSLYIGQDPSATDSTAQYNIGVGATALDAITTLAGGSKQAKEAMALAQALSPEREKFDPAIAALKYFTALGREASKPGATLLGSAAAAATDPAQYLMEVKQYNRKLDACLPQTAICLASSLQPDKTRTGGTNK